MTRVVSEITAHIIPTALSLHTKNGSEAQLPSRFVLFSLFPLFFENLLWLIYTPYCIPKGNFDTDFLPAISFIKNFVAGKVAKSPAEWYQVVVG